MSLNNFEHRWEWSNIRGKNNRSWLRRSHTLCGDKTGKRPNNQQKMRMRNKIWSVFRRAIFFRHFSSHGYSTNWLAICFFRHLIYLVNLNDCEKSLDSSRHLITCPVVTLSGICGLRLTSSTHEWQNVAFLLNRFIFGTLANKINWRTLLRLIKIVDLVEVSI